MWSNSLLSYTVLRLFPRASMTRWLRTERLPFVKFQITKRLRELSFWPKKSERSNKEVILMGGREAGPRGNKSMPQV